ncbi:biogenesis of lysosome-related organelles complex 1 subunit 6 isoform X2 [Centruroides vittatus]|uniref:biogenesis of lysosome-related organelles complex 1 subunit 6-like n=1 Tax=Centruroides sculpturatus TaxID=218467 RepID=UPI000C6E1F5D|nr:biogenesis of lysosome-related organelles complex 1 subunit 6-like [Centruroides sculpturatus]
MNSSEDFNSPTIICKNKTDVIEQNEEVKEKLSEELNNACNLEKKRDSLPEVINKSDKEKLDLNSKDEISLDKDAINKLSSGLLSIYVDNLQNTASNLTELTRNQSILIETIQQENTRFTECTNLYHLDDLFARAKHYHLKLQNIKKEMSVLHERTNKLKKRALKLQQQKQKEALQREQQKERLLEYEKQLIPKLASNK